MIINCKCQKYVFDIPDHEIPSEGRQVRCEFCNDEWFQKNPNYNVETENNNEIENIKKEIPIPKLHKSFSNLTNDDTKIKKNNFSYFIFGFIIFIFLVYLGILENKNLILSYYPAFQGFFESADIVKEIINQNINWIKEIIHNLLND